MCQRGATSLRDPRLQSRCSFPLRTALSGKGQRRRLSYERRSSVQHHPTPTHTGPTPLARKWSRRATASVKSNSRPATYGPRSTTRTSTHGTERFRQTRTRVPQGNVLFATPIVWDVSGWLVQARSPPESSGPYQLATAKWSGGDLGRWRSAQVLLAARSHRAVWQPGRWASASRADDFFVARAGLQNRTSDVSSSPIHLSPSEGRRGAAGAWTRPLRRLLIPSMRYDSRRVRFSLSAATSTTCHGAWCSGRIPVSDTGGRSSILRVPISKSLAHNISGSAAGRGAPVVGADGGLGRTSLRRSLWFDSTHR